MPRDRDADQPEGRLVLPRLGDPDQGAVPIERLPSDVADSVTHLEAGAAGKVRIDADDASGGYPTVCQGGRHLGPAHEPLWVPLYVHPIGDRWAGRILADSVDPPGPEELKGLVLFADTAAEAERMAKAFLRMSEPAN